MYGKQFTKKQTKKESKKDDSQRVTYLTRKLVKRETQHFYTRFQCLDQGLECKDCEKTYIGQSFWFLIFFIFFWELSSLDTNLFLNFKLI